MIRPEDVRPLWATGLADRAVAAALGCKKSRVQAVRAAAGLPARWAAADRVDPARFAALHAGGASDRELAAAFRVGKRTACSFRRRLGLPPNIPRGGGQAAGHAARRARSAAKARRYGLPADLLPRQVDLVLALLDGPLGRAAWFAAAGLRSGGVSTGRQARISYPADLERRGLVARVRRSGGAGGGRLPDVYVLTGPALDMIAGRA